LPHRFSLYKYQRPIIKAHKFTSRFSLCRLANGRGCCQRDC
jgi:hypothetical protein